MKSDNLVLQRFAELEIQAEEISNARVVDFVSNEGKRYYDIPYAQFKGWDLRVLNLLQRVFSENSVHFQEFSEHYKSAGDSESTFNMIRELFLAAKDDYEGGYLFNFRALVKAEVLDDAIEQATEVLKAGYKDPACVLAGVSLEVTLKELCDREKIKTGKLDKMNVDLQKAGIYNMAKQKQITAWADLRNKAAHGEWEEYSQEDVKDFVSGVQRFVADYLIGKLPPN